MTRSPGRTGRAWTSLWIFMFRSSLFRRSTASFTLFHTTNKVTPTSWHVSHSLKDVQSIEGKSPLAIQTRSAAYPFRRKAEPEFFFVAAGPLADMGCEKVFGCPRRRYPPTGTHRRREVRSPVSGCLRLSLPGPRTGLGDIHPAPRFRRCTSSRRHSPQKAHPTAGSACVRRCRMRFVHGEVAPLRDDVMVLPVRGTLPGGRMPTE